MSEAKQMTVEKMFDKWTCTECGNEYKNPIGFYVDKLHAYEVFTKDLQSLIQQEARKMLPSRECWEEVAEHGGSRWNTCLLQAIENIDNYKITEEQQ